MENITLRGVWWPEDNPEKKISGTLEYSPSDLARLSLIGDFDNTLPSGNNFKNYDKILGVTDEGDPITLIDCARDNKKIESSKDTGFISSEYVVSLIINGYSFKNENISFDQLEVSFYGMDKWAQLASPMPGMDLQDPPMVNPGDSFTISLEIPQHSTAWIDGIEFSAGVRGETNFERYVSGSTESIHRFKIKPRRTQVPIDYYFGYIDSLKKFVSFGLGEPVVPRYVRGTVFNSMGDNTDVDIYYTLQKEPDKDISVHPDRHLFSLREVDFEQSLTSWMNKSDLLEDTFNLYFGSLFNTRMYPQNQFLSYCHAIEAYHRKNFNGKYMNDSDFEDFYTYLVEIISRDPENAYTTLQNAPKLADRYNVPSSFQQSLKGGTLKYANEYSLRRRLKEVVGVYDNIISDLPYSIKGKEKLVADTRNYFSHYTDELEKKAAEDVELQKLINGLQQLIETAILSEIGLNDAHIKTRLGNRYENQLVGDI